MKIAYIDPLSQAWGRMTKALFKPFDLSKWFIVGFTAFLAGLADGSHGGGGGSSNYRKGDLDLKDITDFPVIAWEWLLNNPGWFILIVFGLVIVISLVIILVV